MAFPVVLVSQPQNYGKAMNVCALFRTFCQMQYATVLRQLSAIIAGALCAPQHITIILRH